MRWHVYVDLPRRLTVAEQRVVFEALDVLVPESGCVGPNASGLTEIYFVVEAASHEHAANEAARQTDAVLDRAELRVTYVVTLREQQL
jgi:hypothetical protein